MSAQLDPEHRGELERRLGAPHRLDGSFPSLWSLELVLRAVRSAPTLQPKVAWVGPYVRGILERAYRELGLRLVDLGPDLLSVERPGFVTNVAKAVAQMTSQRPPPAGSELSSVLEMALAPRYGLEAVTLGMPLLRRREARHPPLVEPITAWLATEHARAVGLGVSAERFVRALVAPTFGYVASDGAEHVSAIREALTEDPREDERALLALAGSPDRYVALIAARAAIELGIAPLDPGAARGMQRARRHFATLPGMTAALETAIESQLTQGERSREGTDDPSYVRAQELERAGDYYRAHALVDALCREHPERAPYLCLRSTLAAGLGRGKEAEADLFLAQALLPDGDEVRDPLVRSFLERAGAPSAVRAPSPPAAAPPRPAPAPVPVTFEREPDPYEVRELLGEGGMGKVFRVHHRGWGIDLALKIPKKELLERGGLAGFLEEAEAWARLGSHPHTVACHYVRVREGIPWLFAELVEGGSLRSWIEDRRLYQPMPGLLDGAARLVDVARMMAFGLQHAHDHDLIHQDMKPGNVLLSTRGIAKVTDFGLAKVTQLAAMPSSSDGRATMAAGFAGMTPLYCSPEQASAARSGKQVLLTRRTDVWSWGLTVLEMFTGAPTWRSGVLARQALAQARAVAAPGVPAMPAALADLLDRCFAPDEADRPRTMTELAEALCRIQETLTGSPARSVPVSSAEAADVLNNRAASLLDLGRPEDAQAHWRRALAAEPLHLESTYNLSLTRWRRGELTDLAALEAVAGAREADGGPEGHWLEAWLHHERAAPGPLAQAAHAGHARGASGVPVPPTQTPRGIAEDTLGAPRASVQAFAISADGSRWVIATERGLSVHDGREGTVIAERDARASAVAIDRDGRFVASASGERIELWEVALGAANAASVGVVAALAPCGAGAFLAAVDDRVLLVERGGAARELGRHDGPVRGLAAARNGQLVASAGEDGRVELRRLDGSITRTLRHERAVDWVELSADGARALTGSWDAERAHYRLAVWDTASASLVRRLEEPGPRRGAMTDAARHVVSWDERARIRLWRVSDGRCLRTEAREAGAIGDRLAWASEADVGARVTATRFARIGTLNDLPRAPVVLVRPEEDGVLAERAARVAEAIARLERALDDGDGPATVRATDALFALPGHRRHSRAAELLRRVVAATRRGPVRASFPGATRTDLAGPVVALAATHDGDYLAASYDEGRAHFTARPRVFEGTVDDVFEVELDGALDAAAVSLEAGFVIAANGEIRRVDASGAVRLAACAGVRDLAIEGTRVFAAGERGVEVFDLARGAWESPFPIDDVTDVSVAGGTIAIAATRGAPAAWSIAERRPRRALYQEAGRRVELGPAGRRTACLLESVVLVAALDDPADVPVARTIPIAGARAAAFADRDTLLVVGTRGGEVFLVDLEHGLAPRRLGRHDNAVRAVVVSADGRVVASGGRDRSVRLWHVEYARLA